MLEPKQRRTRSDSMLHTGLSSAKERRIRAAQQKLHDSKTQKSLDFTEGGKGLLEWIDKERANVIEDLAKLPFGIDTEDKHIKSELRAFQMHLNFLTRFKTHTKNQLRIKDRADEKARKDAEKLNEGEDDV